MIKAAGTHQSGERYFILGMTELDLQLLQNRPIEVDGHDIGVTGKIVVFYGATQQELVRELNAAGVVLPVDELPDR